MNDPTTQASPGLAPAQLRTLRELDSEGFAVNPRPPLRVNDPASYASALEEAEPVSSDCPVHGGR